MSAVRLCGINHEMCTFPRLDVRLWLKCAIFSPLANNFVSEFIFSLDFFCCPVLILSRAHFRQVFVMQRVSKME